jgi:hypothetical protein
VLDGGGVRAAVENTMTDKEVGKLWRTYSTLVGGGYTQDKAIIALIHKLVEERAIYKYGLGTFVDAMEQALSDFGIDATTWKETT